MRFAGALLLIALLASCGGSQAPVGALDLQALRGQWVVINYWAQWCKPCIKEIPELNELDQEFDRVTVLGVNYDGETGEELAAQIEKLGVAFTTLAQDPSATLGVPRPVVLPTSDSTCRAVFCRSERPLVLSDRGALAAECRSACSVIVLDGVRPARGLVLRPIARGEVASASGRDAVPLRPAGGITWPRSIRIGT